MDWVYDFYSRTGKWWGPAEHKITDRDYKRVKVIERYCPQVKTLLELGAGYGNTAAACAEHGIKVTAIEISDRADFAKEYVEKYKESFLMIKGDFNKVQISQTFDVVVYWDGFGIGNDDDQRRLLLKITNWVKQKGVVLIEIQNPITWKRWNGRIRNKEANPELGYYYNVSQKIEYNDMENRFIDTWWQTENPNEKFTQSIRCYLPPELHKLLEGIKLKVKHMELNGADFTEKNYKQFLDNDISSEYLVVLVKE